MKSRKKAAAAAIAGNVIFGLSFMFSRVVLLTVDTFVMLALRFSIAFLAMNVLVCARVVKVDLKKDLRPLLALGLFQPVLYFTFESLGIKLTNSVISGSMIATVPVAGMLLGAGVPEGTFYSQTAAVRADVPGGGGADRHVRGRGRRQPAGHSGAGLRGNHRLGI